MRSLSGVTPIAIMTKPGKCPEQARCVYCPGGLKSFFGNVPKSYTGNEPASMRAKRNEYDAVLQIFNRLENYVLLNHDIGKCDVIIMGGTFTNFSKQYKDEFVADIYFAFNKFSELFFETSLEKSFHGERKTRVEINFEKFYKFFELGMDFRSPERIEKVKENVLHLKKENLNLEKEQLKNESSNVRCIGLTIETRPDCCSLKQCNEMLEYGVTRVELGIQSVYDSQLKKVKRGHLNKESIEAIKRLKNLGFKINLHYMLGLPSWTIKKDISGLKKLFFDERYRPDMLKIYPCLVMPGTELYEDYKNKKFKPMKLNDAAGVISEFKRDVPRYVRIMRIQRDISKGIIDGVNKTNLRQYVNALMLKKKIKCKCIRCREIKNCDISNYNLNVLEYNASCGKEFFISIDANDKIIGFCRLRFVNESLRKEITLDSGIIRELHVYGKSVKLGEKGEIQHHGFGKMLVKKAEEICLKHNKKKILVISGIGVKGYYKKLGYDYDGVYMSKAVIILK